MVAKRTPIDIVLENSPYYGLEDDQWIMKTMELVRRHPFNTLNINIKGIVLEAWSNIFNVRIGDNIQLGVDISFSQRIIGDLFHALIPMKLRELHPTLFKKDETKEEKDIVFIPDIRYSVEIKTTSDRNNIVGNRNIALRTKRGTPLKEENTDDKLHKKHKSGYYLAINTPVISPEVEPLIRFGWVDHIDWLAQDKPSGQRSDLSGFIRENKFIIL